MVILLFGGGAASRTIPMTASLANVVGRTIPMTAALSTVNSQRTVPLTAAVTGLAPPDSPAAPSVLSGYALANGAILLTWIDNATNEQGYQVLRRTGANPFAVLSNALALDPNTTTFTDFAVVLNTTYEYQVRAFNSSGYGTVSNTITVTTPATIAPGGVDFTDIPSGYYPDDPVYQWIDGGGDLHSLGDPDTIAVELGVRGLLMPPVDLNETETPFTDGARVGSVRYTPREVDLPILVQAHTPVILRERLRELAYWFAPTRGDGKLRVTAPSGEQRELTCRYVGGLENADDDIRQAGPNWWSLAVTLRASDPYFYATAPFTELFVNAAAVPFFPIFPLQLSASNMLSTAAPLNDGDAEAWPVWVVTGPATEVTITNSTTGKSWTLTTDLLAGETVTIDTRPGKKTALLNIGGVITNALGGLTSSSYLWPLAVGVNTLSVALTGSTSATSVRLTFTPRYLGA